MSLFPTIYSSTDPGAPSLSGLPGAMTTLLDAVLVDGYGTGPAAKAPLGWTRAFSATNKRVYRNDPVLGTGTHLRVLDDGSPLGAGRCAKFLAYSSMTDIDNGFDITPSETAHPSGCLVAKSQSADATARVWWAIGNSRAFYLFVGWYNDTWQGHSPHFFGDLISDVPGDMSAFMISGARHIASFTGDYWEVMASLFLILDWQNSLASNTDLGAGSYLLKNAAGTASSTRCATVFPNLGAFGSASTYARPGTYMAPYPDPVTGGVRFCECLIGEGPYRIRGRLPGVVGFINAAPFTNLQELGALPGLPPHTNVLAKLYQTGDYVGGGYSGQVGFLTGVEWQ